MIIDVQVRPRRAIASIMALDPSKVPHKPWILISIYSATTGPLIVTKLDMEILASYGCIDYLPLEFHDITPERVARYSAEHKYASTRFKLFSRRQARKITFFINNFKNDARDVILVAHCEQGVSRSGAVGVYACRYLGLDEQKFRSQHPGIKPNGHVYDTLCEIAPIEGDYERFWENDDHDTQENFHARFSPRSDFIHILDKSHL